MRKAALHEGLVQTFLLVLCSLHALPIGAAYVVSLGIATSFDKDGRGLELLRTPWVSEQVSICSAACIASATTLVELMTIGNSTQHAQSARLRKNIETLRAYCYRQLMTRHPRLSHLR